MSRKLILALAILAVTTTPALARGGGGFTVGSAAAGSVVSSALAVYGDGVNQAYQWVWIPAPVSPPTPPQ